MNVARSLSEARRLGSTRYSTGRACKRGHFAERYASTGQCVSCLSVQAAEWSVVNRDRRNEVSRSWRRRNKPKIHAIARKWYEGDPARVAARKMRHARWRRLNPDKAAVIERRRRAREAAADGDHTVEDVLRILEMQRWSCAYCPKDLRKAKPHIDHIIPLARGGSNDRANLQALCQPCNNRKWAKDPIDFAREIGLLI
jgi:5-methylcytosine-specific restriction endonuclease McrA